jgi:branched-chain amino acid transport system permease protein
MGYFAQQIINGIHLGALYALLAFGYAIAHSVLKRASFAHGALFAFSGQLTILFTGLGWQVLWLVYPAALSLGLVAALAYTALAARVISRSVLQPIRYAAPNTTIAASLGVMIVLMETVRLASGSHMPWLSPFLNGVIVLGGSEFTVTTTPIKLAETLFAALVIVFGGWFLATTQAGRVWRAVSQDEIGAALVGVDGRRVFGASMLWAGLVAGMAGVLAAFHYGNIDFGTGISFAVKVLFVASLGGLSTPLMAAAGGLGVGVFETLWDGYFQAIWRDAATYAVLCALLVATRRSGNLPT